jgi:predicted RNA-binding protein
MTYWIVVGSEENMRIAEWRGFDIFGFKRTRRGEVSKMRPGDKLIFYLTKIMKFGGLAEVTSDYFEDHTKVFKSEKKPGEDYPFRVKVRPEIILSPGQYLDVKEIAPTLASTQRWGANWRLAFQGNLHEIPEEDYERIVGLMRTAGRVSGVAYTTKTQRHKGC